MLHGSCLCGGIRYEVDAPLEKVAHCHCGQCRKASGASFATNASLPATAFRIVEGEELLASWASSPGVHRHFCGRCGSPIIKRSDATPDAVRLRMGTLDDDPGVKPFRHIMVSWKAPWVEISDGLPRSG